MTAHLHERVLCISSAQLDAIGRFQGFCSDIELVRLLFTKDNFQPRFLPRYLCEGDPSFKQIVTYSLIQYSQHPEDKLYFSYTRGSGGGEDRLKKKLSLGIGGHVSEDIKNLPISLAHKKHYEDMKEIHWCRSEAQREIDEEVAYVSRKPLLTLAGLINDDSNEVGRVHLGLVYKLIISDPTVMALEKSTICEPGMLSRREIVKQRDQYESWSQILIEALI